MRETQQHGDALRRVIWRETFAEIVGLLTPEELIVAVLRLEGLSDGQIGRLLGIERAAVSNKMMRARRRVVRRMPELRALMAGRRRRPGGRAVRGVPLEQGWACEWEEGEASRHRNGGRET